jgi:hypothetical protein
MAQTGYTPILIYASGTTGNTPLAANLTSSASGAELALNYFDGKLFYKDASGNVQVLAGKGGTGIVAGSNTQIQFNNSGVFGASANLTWDGTKVTSTGLSITGNTVLGDASADTVTVNGTITSNLIFTDNTYDIGASGATRPRKLYLSSTAVTGGYVGIGGAPSFALDITLNPATSTSPSISVVPATGTNGASMIFTNSGAGSFLLGRSNSLGTGSGTTLGAYSSYIWNTGAVEIEIGTNNTRAIQIDSAQRVGINSPSVSGVQLYALGQSNNIAIRAQGSGIVSGVGTSGGGLITVYDASANGSNTSYGGIRLGSSPGNDFGLWKLSAGATPYFALGIDTGTYFMKMSASGSVAFGSSNPPIDGNRPFKVLYDGGSAAYFQGIISPVTTTQSSGWVLDNAGSGSFYVGRVSSAGTGAGGATLSAYDSVLWNSGNQRIVFGIADGYAGYIDLNKDWNLASDLFTAESVNVGGAGKTCTSGIATPGPASTSATTNYGGIYQIGYSSSAGLPYYGGNWASSGTWGFGTDTGAADNTLRIGGLSFTGGGMAWSGSYIYLKAYITPPSDHRLKENVVDFDLDVYELIDQFRPVYYNIIQPDDEDGTPNESPREIGMIAHEAQAVIGELVRGQKDAVDDHGNMITQSMFYDRTGVVAIKMLQQFKQKFEALKADFESYKASHP